MEQPAYRLGIDIGGTFTDLVLLETGSGQMFTGKTLTTPHDPAQGVLAGLRQLLERNNIAVDEVEQCIHATTLITNALIERKGARTGLITTQGFRDVLAIGREFRYDLYDLRIEMPEPLVPEDLRKEVAERVGSDGSVIEQIGGADVRKAIHELVDANAEAVAIVFLHSYANSAHEEEAERIVAQEIPDLSVSTSYHVSREIREYERTSTTVANAYVQPLTSRYLGRLESELSQLGYTRRLHLMTSAGGITSSENARERPIWLTESGPAAGALAGGFYGQLGNEPNIIAFDMGGTTAKACVIEQSKPLVTYRFEVGRVHRFKKGSGLPLTAPAIDLIEIGAGGGSIARIDRLGLLDVGPDSAGADPGPAAYSRGGTEPTVTDADLLLGYLSPESFLGGEMQLNHDAAERAISERLARQLGRDVTHAAWGVYDVVNEHMASATRIHIAERGKDPRRFALVASGGAGPVHAYRVARKLGLKRVLCPAGAGVASTVGLLVAAPQIDLVHAYVTGLDQIDWNQVNRLYEQMQREATQLLTQLGVPDSGMTFVATGDLRYSGQGFEVVTPLPLPPYGPASLTEFTSAFETAYRSLYGRTVAGSHLEGINWRLRASGPDRGTKEVAESLRRQHTPNAKNNALIGERAAYFPELDGFVPTPVYSRYQLRAGDRFSGPAIVEERESTVVVGPDASVEIDTHGTLIMELKEVHRGS